MPARALGSKESSIEHGGAPYVEVEAKNDPSTRTDMLNWTWTNNADRLRDDDGRNRPTHSVTGSSRRPFKRSQLSWTERDERNSTTVYRSITR